MTDFTSEMIRVRDEQIQAESPGGAFVDQVKKTKEAEDEKRIDGKFRSAFETSGLDAQGMDETKYDFRKAYDNGSTFKPGPHGGANLPNQFIKENSMEIGGRDFATKRQVRERFKGNQNIDRGIGVLQKSSVDTAYGTPWSDVDGLNRIATGIMENGGDFEDFKAELENTPWGNKLEQAVVAWESADTVRESLQDTDNFAKKYKDIFYQNSFFERQANRKPESATPPVAPEPEEVITEADLPTNTDWVGAGRTVIQAMTGEDTSAMDDQQVSDQLLSTMGLFWYNLPEMALMASSVVRSGNKEYAEAFVKAMNMYENADMNNYHESMRFVGGQVSDITNWATFGGGVLMTRLAAKGIREGVKQSIMKMVAGLSVDVAAGAAAGGSASVATQSVEKAAGVRDEIDAGEAGTAALISGAVTGAIGAPLNILADPTLRGYARNAISKGYANLTKTGAPTPGGKRAQTGNVDIFEQQPIDVEMDPTVEFYNPVIRAIKEMYPGSGELDVPMSEKKWYSTVRKLEQQAHKGDFTWEAFDWANLEDIADMWSDGATPRFMGLLIKNAFPKIEYVPSVFNEWRSYSLVPPDRQGSSYFENIVMVNHPGRLSSFAGHHHSDVAKYARSKPNPYRFPANAGHVRGNIIGNKMIIMEEQSDMATAVGGSGSETVGRYRERDIQFAEHQRGLPKKYARMNEEQFNNRSHNFPNGRFKKDAKGDPHYVAIRNIEFRIAEREGIDVFAKNAPAKVWAAASLEEKDALTKFSFVGSNFGDSANFSKYEVWKSPFHNQFRRRVMERQLADAVEKGLDEIYWPATKTQIAEIEHWPDEYLHSEMAEGATKHLLVEKVRMAEKMGLKPEKVLDPSITGVGLDQRPTVKLGQLSSREADRSVNVLRAVDDFIRNLDPKDYYGLQIQGSAASRNLRLKFTDQQANLELYETEFVYISPDDLDHPDALNFDVASGGTHALMEFLEADLFDVTVPNPKAEMITVEKNLSDATYEQIMDSEGALFLLDGVFVDWLENVAPHLEVQLDYTGSFTSRNFELRVKDNDSLDEPDIYNLKSEDSFNALLDIITEDWSYTDNLNAQFLVPASEDHIKEMSTFWRIKITPEMRKEILEKGFPALGMLPVAAAAVYSDKSRDQKRDEKGRFVK